MPSLRIGEDVGKFDRALAQVRQTHIAEVAQLQIEVANLRTRLLQSSSDAFGSEAFQVSFAIQTSLQASKPRKTTEQRGAVDERNTGEDSYELTRISAESPPIRSVRMSTERAPSLKKAQSGNRWGQKNTVTSIECSFEDGEWSPRSPTNSNTSNDRQRIGPSKISVGPAMEKYSSVKSMGTASTFKLNEFWEEVGAQAIPSQQSASDDPSRSMTGFPRDSDDTRSKALHQSFSQSLTAFHFRHVKTERRNRWDCVFEPHSTFHQVWGLFVMLLIVLDFIRSPLQAFTKANFKQSRILFLVMTLASNIFWLLDIAVNFLTGRVVNGQVNFSLKLSCTRYMRSWFFVDLILSCWAWLLFSLNVTYNNDDWLESISRERSIHRFVLYYSWMFFIIRGFKLPRIWNTYAQSMASERKILALEIGKSTLIVILLSHICACWWIEAGNLDADQNWIEGNGYLNADFETLYLAAMQWATAYFMQAEPFLAPYSSGERRVALLVTLLGFIVSAVFVSSVTTSLTRMQIIGGNQLHFENSQLRQYLAYHGVSARLAILIQRDAKRAAALRRNNCMESDITMLKLISHNLREALRYEINGRVLRAHPFFLDLLFPLRTVMRNLCTVAVSVQHSSPGEVLFINGDLSTKPRMVFIMHGHLHYEQITMEPEDVIRNNWACEMVLWVYRWKHRGKLQCIAESTVLFLHAEKFHRAMQDFYAFSDDIARQKSILKYAKAYVEELNLRFDDELTDLDSCVDRATLRVRYGRDRHFSLGMRVSGNKRTSSP